MKPNYFDLSTAHKRIYRARKKLGDETLINFFRVMGNQPDTKAISIINESLDDGQSLDEIFYDDHPLGGGFFLIARDLDETTIELEFGYVAGPLAGDGNTYQLVFEEDGSYTIYPGYPWLS